MIDLLLDNDGELIVTTDLKIGFSDGQNINDILQSNKGEYKRNPQIGLNAVLFSNGNTPINDIKQQCKLQLELDGFRVKDVIVTKEGKDINIEPYAER